MEYAKSRGRNYCLDFVKGVACIFVVFMHCEFPGQFGVVVQAVSRFCVPFFFMVSGYFCYKSDGAVNYPAKIKHIAIITVSALCFYAVLAIAFGGGGTSVTIAGVAKWLVFNQPIIIVGQMWFLFALLYDYILFSILDHFKLYKISLIAIPICIVIYILLAQGLHLLGVSVPNMIYRNWLIEGFPFFSLGYWINRKWNNVEISDRLLIIGTVVATVLCLVERSILGRDFGVNIFTFPQVIFIFLLCIRNKEFGEGKLLTKLGMLYSMYVYIFHPAIWSFWKIVYRYAKVEGNPVAQYCLPILVVIASVIWSMIYLKFISYIKLERGGAK